jgi:signal transduction histidine kinase
MPIEEVFETGVYKVRPAGRHLNTIGRDLIKDKYAAVVELVKNAYDADASNCVVSLLPFEKIVVKDGKKEVHKGIEVKIKDDGHGMSFETVTGKWMVPSTDDKYIRKASPKNRVLQGKKGIGRYSASIVGDDLLLETIDTAGNLTTLYLSWVVFERAKFLEDVDILIEKTKTNLSSGTEIIIKGDEEYLKEWSPKQIQNLKFELKKLIPPLDKDDLTKENKVDNFKIVLELGNFSFDGYSNLHEKIEPYPVFDLFDYRISGTVSKEGIANLIFENNRINGAPKEYLKQSKIFLNQNGSKSDNQTYCGEVKIDFRVFDRDADSIDGLIERGLKDRNTNQSVGRREARHILDDYCGIGVFRNGFRLRPLGDAGYDWLSLDKQRVQNPSVKVGCDQVIGFIHIESEDKSGLEEKSARDGIKETPEYFGLIEIALKVLLELESRRFNYRRQLGLGRSKVRIDDKINTLFDFEGIKNKVDKALVTLGVESEKRISILNIISEKEDENNKIAEDLKQSIALYQGQATLGKVINILMHESSKPLGFFVNQIPLTLKWTEELDKEYDKDLKDKIVESLIDIGDYGKILIHLFDKIKPLSAKRNRGEKNEFKIKDVINTAKNVYTNKLETGDIKVNIDCDSNLKTFGWKYDYYTVFTNLLDNSIYWLQNNVKNAKEISFKAYTEDNLLVIEYRDTGPGIPKEFIDSKVIFEPDWSNKTGGGTGLGLAISGEAIARSDGELKAIYSESGAFFKLEIKKTIN